ncbi:orosomucoid 1 [Phyllostomus discolor]|uniref:Alpha-1-acid glycoprotein 1 n=1 Tax=Phyllostomus discolor TaxID=89673 RepID=A0A6J2NEY2_9CHIR|nr:alpha-1-acid glycoprotein 1 [Phyllostomus discolor]KAF6126216.1 orosomucoid 1 [Phyllostomus discolor]
MALPWVLAVLSLLPLLDAQSPTCTNYTVPITNATLDQISGKWYYIASAFHHLEYKESATKFKASFFYFMPNHTEDKIWVREYSTIGDNCTYEFSPLTIYRENGTLMKYENGTRNYGHLMLPKDRSTFMLAFFPEDPQQIGLSFYADKPEVTPEQMEQFYEDLRCRGMKKSEVLYTDEKKDLCKPLEKQHEEEKKKESERTEKD